MTRIWALADPHLSFARPKPMDIFGEHWRNHAERIAEGCSSLMEEDDILLIPGDLSWALKRHDAEVDLDWLSKLPGTKVLCKGNHDYWWDSDTALGFPGLFDTPFRTADGLVGIAGTRGWTEPSPMMTDQEIAQANKILNREIARLAKRLELVSDCQIKIAMIHYPPSEVFLPTLEKYGVRTIVYGHLHSNGNDNPLPESWHGMKAYCVACDRIGFKPRLVATLA